VAATGEALLKNRSQSETKDDRHQGASAPLVECLRLGEREPGQSSKRCCATYGTGGAFITATDFLMNGGVTPAYWFGDLASK